MFKAAIFDLDGVVVDTERIHYITFKSTLAELDIEIPEKRWYEEFTGTGSRNIIRVLFKERGINQDVDFWFNKRRAAFFDCIRAHGAGPIPDIEQFLSELKSSSIKTAVATGSGREIALFLLDHTRLTEYFDAIITADDTSNKKPHPEVFLKAASALGAQPAECIAFEDSKNGVASAKAAGMKVIGLKSPSLPEKDCVLVIKDYTGFSIKQLRDLF